MIEDTSFVIDILRGDERALERLGFVEAERRPEKVAAITVLELYEGIELADRPDAERARVLEVLDSKHLVPADQGIMQRAGELSGALFAAGDPIDREDCIVAATALQEEEPVIARNREQFERVQGLDVVSY